MSTKIYGGVIFSIHDWRTLRKRFKDLREPMTKIKENHLKRIMSNQAIHKFDKMALGFEEGVPNTDALFRIKMDTAEELAKSKAKVTSNWPYDVNCEIAVIPLKNKTLGYLINHMKEHREFFLAQKWVKEYHYQNQSDQPEDISAKAWKQREKDWDLALPGAGCIAEEAFIFELCSNDFPWGLGFKDIDYRVVAPVEKRARNLAVDQARVRLLQGKDEKKVSISEIMESTRSDEGKALVESLFKEFQPKLKDRYELEVRK